VPKCQQKADVLLPRLIQAFSPTRCSESFAPQDKSVDPSCGSSTHHASQLKIPDYKINIACGLGVANSLLSNTTA